MTAKLGCQVKITKILVRNLEKAAKKVEDTSVLTTNWDDIAGDPSIDIVIELIGGIEPARTYILSALKAGKNVVTANKDLIAVHGKEILETAGESQKDFLFEAAVAGGIPIISPLKNSLEANHVTEVMGIVNGTTNFILTKMDKEGASFETVLKEAQDLGYAERNPEADVEGYDTCRKIAILTAMATGKEVNYEDICTEGITKITDVDFKNVSIISIAAIFIIILLTFKSISLPIILVCVIEFAIFINMGIPAYTGTVLPFIASIVIGTIQLGATVDYAILMTNKYKKNRFRGMDKKEAITDALSKSIQSIIVSALSFFAATFGVGLYSNIDMIGSLCMLMARGAIISMIVVIFILPSMFMVFDRVICASSAGFRNKIK